MNLSPTEKELSEMSILERLLLSLNKNHGFLQDDLKTIEEFMLAYGNHVVMKPEELQNDISRIKHREEIEKSNKIIQFPIPYE